ncbi:MAG: 2-deoxyglucose-6-phosphatase [Glaciihabitans sp.]|nr:2-deoxyglucose-6-phosphatase [Glaciihabitans sp.]
MDGTLVDSTAVVESVWARFADRHGLDVGEILKTSHGRQMKDTVLQWGPVDVDVRAEAHDLSTFEIGQTRGIIALPGADVFANALPRDAVALVTSAPLALAEVRMAVAGIDLPAVVVTADDVDNGKPAPDCYLRAAELLGIEPADAVVFEDAEAGIAAGLAAGMRTVVVGEVSGGITVGLPRIPDYTELGFTVEVDSEGTSWLVIQL